MFLRGKRKKNKESPKQEEKSEATRQEGTSLSMEKELEVNIEGTPVVLNKKMDIEKADDAASSDNNPDLAYVLEIKVDSGDDDEESAACF